MIVNKRELKQALNRVYLKIKPDTEKIQVFQANLTRLLEQCDSKKSEEFKALRFVLCNGQDYKR
jgi:hypothetical protein